MTLTQRYLRHIGAVKRYSSRTVEIYAGIIGDFLNCSGASGDDASVLAALTSDNVRGYELVLLDERRLSPRTVNLHISVLNGFCRFLLSEKVLDSNPVGSVLRPKMSRTLPVVYRQSAMEEYFKRTAHRALRENLSLIKGNDRTSSGIWKEERDRLIIRILYDTGIRRSELLGLDCSDIDRFRKVMRVRGKGNKMREIPLSDSLLEEILLYLSSTAEMLGCGRPLSTPLLVTEKGLRLYPMAVQRVVETELATVGITGRRSPHALRHTIATQLLDNGAELNSIKEMLGHSSLAATQVYTHTSVEKLKKSYVNAHPRAKRGG